MGKYVVRYKGVGIKGAKRQVRADVEDDEPEEEEVVEKKEGSRPEKDVVRAQLNQKPVLPFMKRGKKEPDVATGEKGSAKSGNYGHAGRVGKVGGSAPKPSGNVSGVTSTAAPSKPSKGDTSGRVAGVGGSSVLDKNGNPKPAAAPKLKYTTTPDKTFSSTSVDVPGYGKFEATIQKMNFRGPPAYSLNVRAGDKRLTNPMEYQPSLTAARAEANRLLGEVSSGRLDWLLKAKD